MAVYANSWRPLLLEEKRNNQKYIEGVLEIVLAFKYMHSHFALLTVHGVVLGGLSSITQLMYV